MPCPKDLHVDTYKAYREKAISRAIELVGEKGIPYVKTVAADIEKILKTKDPKPTNGDIKALEPLVGKISSRSPSIFWEGRDWVAGAQVKCDDFLGCGMAR